GSRSRTIFAAQGFPKWPPGTTLQAGPSVGRLSPRTSVGRGCDACRRRTSLARPNLGRGEIRPTAGPPFIPLRLVVSSATLSSASIQPCQGWIAGILALRESQERRGVGGVGHHSQGFDRFGVGGGGGVC